MATTTTSKPKLPPLKTPMTSTFPSELSALSARSPMPSLLDLIKQEDSIKTPITPPVAYTDFLKSMASPAVTPTEKSSGGTTPVSAPSTGSSEHSDCSCNCETHKSPSSTVPPTPFAYPSSAPSSSRLTRLRIPVSPAVSSIESPLSASSAAFSARSTRSPFDWDFKSKGRYFDVKSPRSSVRQVREIVTRTVTYTHTPRMSPAPKGKRRKIE